MWRVAVFAPLLVAGSRASPQADKNNVSSILLSSASSQPDSFNAQAAPSPIYITLSDTPAASSSTQSLALSSSSLSGSSASILRDTSNVLSSSSSNSQASSSLVLLITTTWTIQTSSVLSRSFSSSGASREISSSRLSLSSSKGLGNASTTGLCTGCAIQAYNPITTFFNSKDVSNRWTAMTVTATLVTEFTTYQDTVVTNIRTMNKTSSVIASGNQIITHTTPTFTVDLMSGTKITLDAGPTYVIYDDLWGGLDKSVSKVFTAFDITLDECKANPTSLANWRPTRTEDWKYFITSHTTNPPFDTRTNMPVPLPSNLVQYLQNNLAIMSQYQGSNIATCTIEPSKGMDGFPPPPPPFPIYPSPIATQTRTVSGNPVFTQVPTNAQSKTFISMTYETTSTHSTVVGCLRIGCGAPEPTPPGYLNNGKPTPKQPDNVNVQSVPNDSPPSRPDDGQDGSRPDEQRPPGNPVTIGGTGYTVRPGPTSNPDNQNEQNQPPPVVIIGDQTLTRGQSTDINGVPVIVPTDGGGTRIIVGGTTVAVDNGPTALPILTVGGNTVTANAQGQFVVGTETLKPGGPAVTVGGSTLSLGPGGTIAIVNGVTQTLANFPLITSPPVLTVGGRVISATIIGGTTQLVLGDQTLSPGGPPLTISGTTYSLPSTGNAIVINGVTSTLSPNQNIGNHQITATVHDGTTAFIFSPSQTLTPGGTITFSGTTFAMPASNIIVVNGVTSTLSSPMTAGPLLTINGKIYIPTVRSGTTEFVIAPGTTLRPGESVVLAGTTYSLDKAGTALVVNGKTSSIPMGPARNSASTTASSTRARDVGDFVWSGIGGGGGQSSTSKGGGVSGRQRGWVDGFVIGLAGWAALLV